MKSIEALIDPYGLRDKRPPETRNIPDAFQVLRSLQGATFDASAHIQNADHLHHFPSKNDPDYLQSAVKAVLPSDYVAHFTFPDNIKKALEEIYKDYFGREGFEGKLLAYLSLGKGYPNTTHQIILMDATQLPDADTITNFFPWADFKADTKQDNFSSQRIYINSTQTEENKRIFRIHIPRLKQVRDHARKAARVGKSVFLSEGSQQLVADISSSRRKA